MRGYATRSRMKAHTPARIVGGVESLIIAVAGLIAIALTSQLSEKIGVAQPLILLALGAGIGFLPQVSSIEIAPEILLEIILPPLLFGAAVSMPLMDFRRDIGAVAGLAVGLVILTAVALGFLIHWLVPQVALAWAIALGAVISPTDAVAVSITKRQGVSQRIITVLEGEGLFNDATALVLLSAATSAALLVDEAALEPASLLIGFIRALVLAVVIGWIVGEVGIRVRARITEPATDTVLSFAMPFIASIPTSWLGGSGLVAAVVAGLVVSHRRAIMLPAMNRVFAQNNWRALELILEGFVFLTMGLQAFGVVEDVRTGSFGLGIPRAALLALILGAATLLLRATFVAPFLTWIALRHSKTGEKLERSEERLRAIEARIATAAQVDEDLFNAEHLTSLQWDKAVKAWHKRLEKGWKLQRRRGNDLAYFTRESLGPREGAVIVWAGMRGAVTLAGAQTLPLITPSRSFLLLIALLVAAGSLAIQGFSLAWFIRLVRPKKAAEISDQKERERLLALLGSTLKESALAHASAEPLGHAHIRVLAVEAIREQRVALIDARDEGVFSTQALEHALDRLDHEEIMLTSFHH